MQDLSNIVNETGEYVIPVHWEVYSTVVVEASNLQEAIDICKARIDDLPLGEGEYVDNSYAIDDNGENDEILINAQSYQTNGGIVIRKDGTIEHI